jgi:hypothetical protein
VEDVEDVEGPCIEKFLEIAPSRRSVNLVSCPTERKC